jgi:serine/threonine-protein kinase
MSAQSKRTLGRYELIREVARSNDIVYEAWDPVTQRRVAVKVLNLPSSASEAQKVDRKQRFEREARAAARLHHTNIVTLFDYGTEDGQDFLVFEFVEGPTLADKLLQDGPFSSDLCIEYSSQLLSALGYAHSQGVIHRDVKPSNIFVCEGNWLKISDLGIARIESETSVTTDGQIFGTPAYMAPEQVRGLDIDRRVDVWAAGVVLFQMSTGSQPFKGGSVLEIGSSVLNQEPDLDLVTDPKIRQVVAKALNKDPATGGEDGLDLGGDMRGRGRAWGGIRFA